MLTAVQHNLPSAESEPKSNNKIGVLTKKKAIENFRYSQEDVNELIIEENAVDEDLQLADRVFCATIHKFTKQNCPDSSPNKKRSTRYSFLENWFLHKIYSKSQQTLLGVSPVTPAVILSGDDFMFTPPFLQSPPPQFEDMDDEDYYYDEDDHWEANEYLYSLSPCPESKQAADNDFAFYRHQDEHEEDRENNRLKMLSTAFLKSPSLVENPICFYSQDDMYNFVAENIQLEEEDVFLEDERIRSLSDIKSLTINTQQAADDSKLSDEDESSDSLSGLSDPATQDSDVPGLSYSATTIHSASHEDMFDDEEASGSYHSTTENIMIPVNKTNEDDVSQITQISPVTRSSTFLSQRSSLDDDSSVYSYQSLADIINSQQPPQATSLSSIPSKIYRYGSIKSQAIGSKVKSLVNTLSSHHANNDEEMGLQTQQQMCHDASDSTLMSLWTCLVVYVISTWQMLINSMKRAFSISTTDERQPLL